MGEFIIPVYIDDEQDIYSRFDPDGLTFGSELIDYLTDYLEDRGFGEKVTLQIHATEKFDAKRFETAYRNFIDKHKGRVEREIKLRTANAIRLMIIGVAFVIIGLVFAKGMNQVLAFIISTTGSFSVWQSAAIWIELLPVLRKKKIIIYKLLNSELRYM